MTSRSHIPVLCAESVEALHIQPDKDYVDATFGDGGHSRSILAQLKTGTLYAFDQDEEAPARAQQIEGRLEFISSNFRDLRSSLASRGVREVSGILADLGMSTRQLYDPCRGFGSMHPLAQLDMRMQQQASTPTAANLLNGSTMAELEGIFGGYGELRAAARLSRVILETRDREPFSTVGQLREALRPYAPPKQQARFWAQVFQSLRIAVNDELGALRALLEQSAHLLVSGGRCVIIAYHSLEDRLVKRFLQRGHFERDPLVDDYGRALAVPFVPLHKKPILSSSRERLSNPASRSAKMRAGIKNAAPFLLTNA